LAWQLIFGYFSKKLGEFFQSSGHSEGEQYAIFGMAKVTKFISLDVCIYLSNFLNDIQPQLLREVKRSLQTNVFLHDNLIFNLFFLHAQDPGKQVSML